MHSVITNPKIGENITAFLARTSQKKKRNIIDEIACKKAYYWGGKNGAKSWV